MSSYILRRLIALVLVLVAVSFITFIMLWLIPGDPARHLAGLDADLEDVERYRKLLGLDQPLHKQYLDFLVGAVQLDFGNSLRTNEEVGALLVRRFPSSAILAVSSLTLAVVVAVPAGILAALHRGKLWDNIVMWLSVLGVSTPGFWLGMLLIRWLSVDLELLPTSGFAGPAHLVLPSLTLAAFLIAMIARFTRTAMLDVLQQDYVRTAYAKGLHPISVTSLHALRNAAIPIGSIVGLQFGALLGASAVIETLFTWPGIGWLLVDAIKNRDLPVVQGVTVLIATAYALVNLGVDVLYGLLDPRIRY